MTYQMNKKRIVILVLIFSLTMASMGACGSAASSVDPAGTPVPTETTTSVPVPTDAPTAATAPTSTPTPTAAPTSASEPTAAPAATTEPTPTAAPTVAPTSNVYPSQVSLSGNRDDHLLTDELCCIEGDKFFLIVAAGADIPGDFADNVSLIMDRMEEETGLTFDVDWRLAGVDNSTVDYGYNPWEGFDFKDNLPIYIKVDLEDVGYIPCATAEFVTLYMYELFSEDVWNSVPSYRDNSWRRNDHIDYYTVAHELTHSLTERYAHCGKILTEGCADYVAEKVIDSLASVSPDFEGSVEVMYRNFDYMVEDDVTPENAEEIFRNDYSDLSVANRGDEYTLGRMICSFLSDTYGESFLRDYINACRNAGYSYEQFWGMLEDEDRSKLADVFKETFGDDVFVNFGRYYQAHKSDGYW